MAPADVCLVLEGTYPYISGGVSHWVDSLLQSQRDLSFHLVCLMPANADPTQRYKVPSNVTGITNVEVGVLQRGAARVRDSGRLLASLEGPLRALQFHGGLRELSEVMDLLRPSRAQLGQAVLLDCPEAWELMLRIYRSAYGECAFLDYFWTWRAILGGLYSVLLAPMPKARLYHSLCTGYAGLFAARARIETGRPALLTEHGIYTNERRIEIAMADWLHQNAVSGLRLEKPARDLKDLWIDTFTSYSRACYEASSRIITLYGGNQQLQIADGADPAKLEIIPNGVDYEQLTKAAHRRTEHPPTVALIGRVVPIKDIKTYIRSVAILREIIPDVRALLLGPENEDPDYLKECQALVDQLGIRDCFTFRGRVSVADCLGEIDVLVLTSISEAQPLVILEAGSAGIPSVVTDVGACREIVYGDQREGERLGAAGEVVPLSNPTAAAQAVARLLKDPFLRESAGRAIRERVRLYYNKPALDLAYRDLYRYWGAAEPAALLRKDAA
jgi:glycosyltransferase involved in cell wall biosynthesis